MKPVPWKLKQARPLLDDRSETALSPLDPTNLAIVTLHGTSGKTGMYICLFLFIFSFTHIAIEVKV